MQKIKQPPAALLANIEQSTSPPIPPLSSTSSVLDFNSNENDHSVDLDLKMPALCESERLQTNLPGSELVLQQMSIEWDTAFQPVANTQLL